MNLHRSMFLLTAISGAIFTLQAQEAIRQQEDPDSLLSTQFSLDEIVVTGTRVPKLMKDTPVQTRLITSKDIEKSDATNIGDLLQQEMPGVEFSYAMNQQVHLNFVGFGGQSVLFLVDGERLAGETMDDVDFSRLDVTNVERVEIVRGASSALYGSNAGGGVINIITREASRPYSINFNGRIGKHADRRLSLAVNNRYKILRNVFSASYSGLNNYDVNNGPDPATRVISTIYGHDTWNIREQLSISPAGNLKLTGRAGYFYRQIVRTEDTPERYRDYSAGARAEWGITDHDDLHISYAFDQYDKSDYHKISGLDIRGYSNVQNSLRALYSHNFNNGDVITGGADLIHDYLMNTKLEGRTRKQTSADAFLQYDWIASKLWEIVGVLRYDYFSDGDLSRVTPKISARYRPLRNLNLRMAYGMGFRAPSLKEKYYDFDMAGIWIVKGNPTLKPEQSHNINISAEYTKRNYNFTATAYYNHVTDKIATGLPYYLPGETTQPYLDYVNLDNYNVYGCEVSIQGAWNNGLTARISYAYTHEHAARDKEGNTANNQYIPARPHSLTARADWHREFSRNYSLSADINGRFLSGVTNLEYKDYYDIAAGTTNVNYPAYTLWKLSVTQQFYGKVKLTLTFDNIFNYRPEYYYLNCPLTDGISFLAGISVNI